MNLTNKRFKSGAMRILFHALPRRTKRLMFIASLSGKVTGMKEMDRETRLRLQKKFNLCKDPDAISMPLAMCNVIWGSRPVEDLVCPLHLNDQMTEHDWTRTARQIIVLMPCLLVYGKTKDIIDDARELLMMREELFQ